MFGPASDSDKSISWLDATACNCLAVHSLVLLVRSILYYMV